MPSLLELSPLKSRTSFSISLLLLSTFFIFILFIFSSSISLQQHQWQRHQHGITPVSVPGAPSQGGTADHSLTYLPRQAQSLAPVRQTPPSPLQRGLVPAPLALSVIKNGPPTSCRDPLQHFMSKAPEWTAPLRLSTAGVRSGSCCLAAGSSRCSGASGAGSGCYDDGGANALDEVTNTPIFTGEMRLLCRREPGTDGRPAGQWREAQAGRKRQCVSCEHPILHTMENGEDDGKKRGDGR